MQGRDDGLRKKNLAILTLTTLSCLLIFLTFSLPVLAQSGQNAKITNVQYAPIIHSGNGDTWTLTIHNPDRVGDNQTAARFYFEVEIDGGIFFDEYNSSTYQTWPCNVSQSVSHHYQTNIWTVTRPETHEVTVKLYWFSQGVAHLEDTVSFSIGISMLVPLQHVLVVGYLAIYLIGGFLLFAYDYVRGTEE